MLNSLNKLKESLLKVRVSMCLKLFPVVESYLKLSYGKKSMLIPVQVMIVLATIVFIDGNNYLV